MTRNTPHRTDRIGVQRQDSIHQRLWSVFGRRLPDKEVVFFTQVILLYIIIITCIVNLSLGSGDSNLWTCLLSSCLGYLLPNPRLESKGDKNEKNTVNGENESLIHNPNQ